MRNLIVLVSLLAGVHVSSAADRPNILWITCEDISPYLNEPNPGVQPTETYQSTL